MPSAMDEYFLRLALLKAGHESRKGYFGQEIMVTKVCHRLFVPCFNTSFRILIRTIQHILRRVKSSKPDHLKDYRLPHTSNLLAQVHM